MIPTEMPTSNVFVIIIIIIIIIIVIIIIIINIYIYIYISIWCRSSSIHCMSLKVLGVDSLPILFKHRSLKKKKTGRFFLGFGRFSRKKDPWKAWGR